MKKLLHTSKLEKHFGKISSKLLFQLWVFRGIQMFSSKDEVITTAFSIKLPGWSMMNKKTKDEIAKGGLIGKTLLKNKYPVKKKFIIQNFIFLKKYVNFYTLATIVNQKDMPIYLILELSLV